jgi:hypothetical protein
MIISKNGNSMTRSAITLTTVNARVFSRVFVAFVAIGLGALLFCPGSRANKTTKSSCASAHNVHLSRNWFQVSRIDASANAAEMVQIKAFWNRPDVKFVGDSVRGAALLIVIPQFPIAVLGLDTLPEPAACFRFDGNILEQSLQGGQSSKLVLSHVILLKSRWSGPGDVSSIASVRSDYSEEA